MAGPDAHPDEALDGPPDRAPVRGSEPEVHAAIDIGTNSVHLLIARVGTDGTFEILAQEKEPVRLGSGSGDMRTLEPDAIDRGIAALTRFGQLAASAGADVTAVATSAVREAENRAEFLGRARTEAGIEVDVISGVEEARLIHLGVLQALPVLHQQILVIDIGGGSTELLVGKGGDVLSARSVKLGAIRLTDRFFPRGRISGRAVTAARVWIRSFLTQVVRELSPYGFDLGVGSSGTIENIAAMVEHRRGREPTTLNNVRFTPADLAEVVEDLCSHPTAKKRREVAGLDSGRADTIVAGALLLEAVMELFGVGELAVSDYALREGVFLDRHLRRHGDDLSQVADIRRDSVQRLAQLFQEDREHVEHSTDLALQLFDDLRPVHGRGRAERDLLESAGWVHNVGLFISHSAHHKHSYYVIRHSDRLVGFTDHEIELIAQIARYHRKSEPKAKHPEFAALDPDDQDVVRLLGGLLRVGIALDRRHDGRVLDVAATTDDVVVITVGADAEPDLELYTARDRCGLLEGALGRRVVFVEGRPTPD